MIKIYASSMEYFLAHWAIKALQTLPIFKENLSRALSSEISMILFHVG